MQGVPVKRLNDGSLRRILPQGAVPQLSGALWTQMRRVPRLGGARAPRVFADEAAQQLGRRSDGVRGAALRSGKGPNPRGSVSRSAGRDQSGFRRKGAHPFCFAGWLCC
eukprot:scaffold2113_cov233-Pinguiococcus_pyrenoidosus.AAC.20